jgi:hypothetical protein
MQTIHESATETAANVIDFASKLAEKKKAKEFDESLTAEQKLKYHFLTSLYKEKMYDMPKITKFDIDKLCLATAIQFEKATQYK